MMNKILKYLLIWFVGAIVLLFLLVLLFPVTLFPQIISGITGAIWSGYVYSKYLKSNE
jgi:hypothetical protein